MLGRQRQTERCESEASMVYTVRPYLKKQTQGLEPARKVLYQWATATASCDVIISFA